MEKYIVVSEEKRQKAVQQWGELRDRVEEELEVTDEGFTYSFKFKLLHITSDRVYFITKWDNIEYGVKDVCSDVITVHGKIKRKSTTYQEECITYIIPNYFEGIDLVGLLKSRNIFKS